MKIMKSSTFLILLFLAIVHAQPVPDDTTTSVAKETFSSLATPAKELEKKAITNPALEEDEEEDVKSAESASVKDKNSAQLEEEDEDDESPAPATAKKTAVSELLEDDEYLDDEYTDAEGPAAAPGLLDNDGIVIRTGPMEDGCVDVGSRFEGQVLTDFIPLVKSARECQNACQSHNECSFFSFYAGSPGDLDSVQEGDEIDLYVPELEDPDTSRRRLQLDDQEEELDLEEAEKPIVEGEDEEIEELQLPQPPQAEKTESSSSNGLPTAQEVLADPQAGACFFFGPYVKPVDALNFESAPRACPTECSALYSENCRTTKCCVRSTAQCVSKDSFFGQCRLPTDACPGKSWECRNITYYADGCLEYDIDYAPTAFGNDVEEVLDVPTELSCQQLCRRHPKCNYWSYNPWYKQMCLLKKRSVPKRRSKGIISGRKSCIGMEQPTLFEYLMLNEQSYKTTIKFIKAANLEEDLSKPREDNRSIFVPTELAWKKLDDTIKEKMVNNVTLARDIITTHILPSVIYPERVIGARSFAALKASNGQTIALSRRASDGDILRINDAEILTSDYPLKGYLLSTIDDILLPNYVIFMIENGVEESGSGGSSSDEQRNTSGESSNSSSMKESSSASSSSAAADAKKKRAAIRAAARAKAIAAARAKLAASRRSTQAIDDSAAKRSLASPVVENESERLFKPWMALLLIACFLICIGIVVIFVYRIRKNRTAPLKENADESVNIVDVGSTKVEYTTSA